MWPTLGGFKWDAASVLKKCIIWVNLTQICLYMTYIKAVWEISLGVNDQCDASAEELAFGMQNTDKKSPYQNLIRMRENRQSSPEEFQFISFDTPPSVKCSISAQALSISFTEWLLPEPSNMEGKQNKIKYNYETSQGTSLPTLTSVKVNKVSSEKGKIFWEHEPLVYDVARMSFHQ